MAYTITSLSGDATVVGTSSSDDLTASTGITGAIALNSFEGNDSIVLSTAIDGGTAGMGGGIDTVELTANVSDVNFTLGDSADIFTIDAGATPDGITVGGQGGADSFTLDNVTSGRFAGGQGTDSFSGSIGSNTTIVGGSEDDTINVSSEAAGATQFINGQVGEDDIDFVSGTGDGATIRGGSEDDTIDVTGDNDSMLLAGDNGADAVTDAGGNNSLLGGGGADTLDGNGGLDTINSGEGTDRILYGALGEGGFVSTAADNSGAAVDNVNDLEEGDSLFFSSTGGAGDDTTGDFESLTITAGDTIRSLNGDTVDNALDDGFALTVGESFYVTGNFLGSGAFQISATGADAAVFIGTDATESGAGEADGTNGANWLLVVGGGTTVSDATFA